MRRDAEIAAAYRAGVPVKHLQLHPGSQGDIYAALRRQGVAPNRRVGDWWPQALRLAAEGLNTYQIARRLGRSETAVRYALRQRRPAERGKHLQTRITVTLGGVRTSLKLEAEFLLAVEEIAARQGVTRAALIREALEHAPRGANRAQAVRVHVLKHYQRLAAAMAEPAEGGGA